MGFSVRAALIVLCFVSLALCFKNAHYVGDVQQYSGYIEYNTTTKANLFYWFFESQRNPATAPVVLWMTGGPGCASTLALFAENGPYKIQSDLTLQPNPYSWNTFANLLYVDQPVGTGFSYVDDPDGYVDDETGVDVAMYEFLQLFFAKYPKYASLPFYIVGESYGGHYVPSLGAYIAKANQAGAGKRINLRGIGIGNGWISPLIQYGAYAPFGLAEQLIDKATASSMNQTYSQCAAAINAQQWDQAGNICGGLMTTILNQNPGLNYYDIRKSCVGPLCYNFNLIEKYLNQPAVQAKLGINPARQWSECSDSVNARFAVDQEESFRFDIPMCLAANYSVIVYSGDKDLICNYFGGIALLESMAWPGQAGFLAATNTTWSANSQLAGWAKAYQGLTWVQVHNAGHMVPMDQPAAALDLLGRFLNNLPFDY